MDGQPDGFGYFVIKSIFPFDATNYVWYIIEFVNLFKCFQAKFEMYTYLITAEYSPGVDKRNSITNNIVALVISTYFNSFPLFM